MSVVEWQEKVRITTGEISRASYFTLARDVNRLGTAEGQDPTEAMQMINDFAIIKATFRVEVKQGDEWVEVKDTAEFEHKGNLYTISNPPTHEVLDALPASLSLQWVESAQQDNAELLGSVFFGSGGARKKRKPNATP